MSKRRNNWPFRNIREAKRARKRKSLEQVVCEKKLNPDAHLQDGDLVGKALDGINFKAFDKTSEQLQNILALA